VLGIQVLSSGVVLPSRWVAQRENGRTLALLLVPVMISSWLICAGLVYAIVPNMRWAEALVMGAICTPTDPILAGSVLKGHFAERHVAPQLRNVLLAESGVNDGLATPFLYFALSIYTATANGGTIAWGPLLGWFTLNVVLYNVLVGFLVGLVIGYILRRMLEFSRTRNWIDGASMLVFSAATAIAVVALLTVMCDSCTARSLSHASAATQISCSPALYAESR
jgi:NhaP-type Na+/H+ or K+/H+ antiporter